MSRRPRRSGAALRLKKAAEESDDSWGNVSGDESDDDTANALAPAAAINDPLAQARLNQERNELLREQNRKQRESLVLDKQKADAKNHQTVSKATARSGSLGSAKQNAVIDGLFQQGGVKTVSKEGSSMAAARLLEQQRKGSGQGWQCEVQSEGSERRSSMNYVRCSPSL